MNRFFSRRNPDADYVLYVAPANNMAEGDRRYESSSRLSDVEARRFWDSHEQSAGTLELISDLVVDCASHKLSSCRSCVDTVK
jgi:hypothetical protein